jgi:radical SAM superfamily enzyme YgiQ (UPF0313 family)
LSRKALLINPPVYDTQYWERWSLPHGLLKVATYLKESGYETRLIDCLLPDEKGHLRKKVREVVEIGAVRRSPIKTEKERLGANQRYIYSFGKDIEDLEKDFRQGLLFENGYIETPDEVWITSIMTYWWESTRDVIALIKRYFPKVKVRLGGIYPTLAPEHAKQKLGLNNPLVIPGDQLNLNDPAQMSRDLIVVKEIPAANDLPLDFELYSTYDEVRRPKYTILTTSRGCPRDCEYCAAYELSGKKIRSRTAGSVIEEIKVKYHDYKIREFCFYEDNLLMSKRNFKDLLTRIIDDKELKGIELHSPEGLEIRLVDQELANLMYEAGFRRVYLPLETIDYNTLHRFSRDFYTYKQFEDAVRMFQKAGFTKPQQINVFVLFGLPGEDLQNVYDTALYAANLTGSVIPMLFAPVPSTPLFKKLLDYTESMGFDLQDLNGKLLPFFEYNAKAMKYKYELTVQDYYDIEALMFRLNEKVRNDTFKPGAESRVSKAFREVFKNYESLYGNHRRVRYNPEATAETELGHQRDSLITEYHGTAPDTVQITRA